MTNFINLTHNLVFFFILAGGHVRASAGALAVHTALILTRVTRD